MFKQTSKTFTLLLLAGLLLATTAAATMRTISANDANNLLKQTPTVFLLDVRTLGEFMQKRIAGAHLIPIDQLQNRIAEIPKNQTILVYCEVGSRSELVAGYLTRLGYPEVYNLSGGIMAWQVRGYPILTGMP